MADKELSAIANQCANDHGDNWDKYKICADEILPTAKRQRSEQHHANDQAQVAIFYNYCSNASTFISTDYSDKECLAWTWQISNSYPGDASSLECWGVTNVSDIRLEAIGKEANALACIGRKSGVKLPSVPTCDVAHPKRLACA